MAILKPAPGFPLERAWRHAAALSAALGLALLYRATARSIELIVDGRSITVHTHARSVDGLLREQGIAIGISDYSDPPAGSRFAASGDRTEVLEVRHARPVLLEIDQKADWFFTATTEAHNILSEAGFSIFPGDELIVDGLPHAIAATASRTAPARLAIRSAYTVELEANGDSRILRSSAPTLGEALWEHGIVLYAGDRLVPGPETPLREGMHAHLVRSLPVRIVTAEMELRTRTSADTVGGALRQAGLTLQGFDYAIPAEDTPLPPKGHIRVIRVQERVEVDMQPLAFDTLYQPLPEVEIDNQQILEAGSYGVKANRVRVRLEDGEEVSRIGQGDWVAKEPTDQIVGYGTEIVIRSLDTADGTVQYWRAVEMYATSYSPSRAGIPEDHPWFGITASGKPAGKGLVAIDRSLIPFGTLMYVPGYGYAEAADTGGGVKGRWIDLGYDDDNYVPWHQYLTVYFLTPVPPPDNIVWIFP